MAITFNPAGRGGDGEIAVTGYTELAPCTFEDVYQADQTGGWGVVTKQGNKQYLFTCQLTLGDGVGTETWFQDYGCQIEYTGCETTNIWFIYIYSNTTCKLGELRDAVTKETRYGCTFLSVTNGHNHTPIYNAAGYLYIMSCHFEHTGAGMAQLRPGSETYVWNSTFVWMQFADSYNILDFFNCVFLQSYNPLMYLNGTTTVDRLTIFDSTGTVKFYPGDYTINNLYARGCAQAARLMYWTSGSLYMIDCDMDNWTVYDWPGTTSGTVYRQYSVDLKVIQQNGTAISGAAVVIKDGDGNTIYSGTTDGSGDIPTQIITYAEYTMDPILLGDNTQITLKGPHTFDIQVGGYYDYYSTKDLDSTVAHVVALKALNPDGELDILTEDTEELEIITEDTDELTIIFDEV